MRQDHDMTPSVLDARQQQEPNHPCRRADDADHSAQTLDMVQTDLIKRLRIKAGMIQMGERIEWGSETDLMYEAADVIERMMASEEQYTPADMADQGAKQFRAGQSGMYTAEDMADQGAQGWRDGYAWAKGEGCPEGYVMVPVVSTTEMDIAGTEAGIALNRYDAELVWNAMIEAAPAVQGEPVGEVRFELGAPSSIFAELYSKSLPVLAPGTKLYAAPQPAPDVAGLVEALEHGFPLLDDNGLDAVEHHCEWSLQQDRKRLHALIAAHKQGDRIDGWMTIEGVPDAYQGRERSAFCEGYNAALAAGGKS